MANEFVDIKLYQRAIDTALVHESKSDILRELAPNAYGQVDFREGGVVAIPRLQTSGLGNYLAVNSGVAGVDYTHYYQNGQTDGYKKGNTRLSWDEFRLQFNRSRSLPIDRVAGGYNVANIPLDYVVSRFSKETVVPEIDASRFAYLASRANVSFGTSVTENPTADGGANDIYTLIEKGFSSLYEMGVPEEDQVVFVNPQIYNLLKNSGKLTRYLNVRDLSYNGIDLKIETFDGRPLVQVPSNRFFSKIVLGDEGYAPANDAVSINYLIVSARSTLIFDVLSKLQVWDSDSFPLNFDGWQIDYHLYHGIYVPTNKVPSVYVSLGKGINQFSGNRLYVATVAGQAAGTTVVREANVIPGNVYFSKIAYEDAATDHNYGDKITTTLKVVGVGQEFNAGDNVNELRFFGLTDDNVVVAKSNGLVQIAKK